MFIDVEYFTEGDFSDFVAYHQKKPKLETYLGHKRHVFCGSRCKLITFSYKSLPKEIWVTILEYLGFFDLINVKILNKFFLNCSNTHSSQRKLFIAPLDERVKKKYKKGKKVQLHPALHSFGGLFELRSPYWKPRDKREEREVCFSVGRRRLNQLSKEFKNQNATNPPVAQIRLFKSIWTRELLRDFIANPDQYEKTSKRLWRTSPLKKSSAVEPSSTSSNSKSHSLEKEFADLSLSEAITIGDLLDFLRMSYIKTRTEQDDPDWDPIDFFDDEALYWEELDDENYDEFGLEDALNYEEDEGHGTELNWEHHFKRLKRDEWLLGVREKYRRETSTDSARLILDARFESPFRLRVHPRGGFYVNLFEIGFIQEPLAEVETRWV